MYAPAAGDTSDLSTRFGPDEVMFSTNLARLWTIGGQSGPALARSASMGWAAETPACRDAGCRARAVRRRLSVTGFPPGWRSTTGRGVRGLPEPRRAANRHRMSITWESGANHLATARLGAAADRRAGPCAIALGIRRNRGTPVRTRGAPTHPSAGSIAGTLPHGPAEGRRQGGNEDRSERSPTCVDKHRRPMTPAVGG